MLARYFESDIFSIGLKLSLHKWVLTTKLFFIGAFDIIVLLE